MLILIAIAVLLEEHVTAVCGPAERSEASRRMSVYRAGVATLELTEVNGQPAPGGGQPGEPSAIRRHLVVVVGFSVGKEQGDGDERRGRGRRRIRKTWRGGATREDQREGEDPHCPRPLAR